MRDMTMVVIVGFVLLSAGGWICLLAALRRRRRIQAVEEARRGRATGQIVAFSDTMKGGRRQPVVEFTAEGRLYRLEAPANPEAASVGEGVEVRYDPDDPAQFHIESREGLNRDGGGLLKLAVAWIAVCAALAVVVTMLPMRQQLRLRHMLDGLGLPQLFEKKADDPKTTDPSGEYQYLLWDNGLATIEKYNGSAQELTVPLVVDGHAVTGLSMGAFSQARSLASVSVPGYISSIPMAAFAGCLSLREVTLGEGVASIGSQAFMMCASLRRVSLPASLAAIAADAFPEDCKATFEVPRDSYAQKYCEERGFAVQIAE